MNQRYLFIVCSWLFSWFKFRFKNVSFFDDIEISESLVRVEIDGIVKTKKARDVVHVAMELVGGVLGVE